MKLLLKRVAFLWKELVLPTQHFLIKNVLSKLFLPHLSERDKKTTYYDII